MPKKHQDIITMNDLLEKLQKEAGLTPEQAVKAITTIADYVKEQFPMLGGAVDNIFSLKKEQL